MAVLPQGGLSLGASIELAALSPWGLPRPPSRSGPRAVQSTSFHHISCSSYRLATASPWLRWVHREPVDHVRTVRECRLRSQAARAECQLSGLRAVGSGQAAELLCALHLQRMTVKVHSSEGLCGHQVSRHL